MERDGQDLIQPVRARHGMVVSQQELASPVGAAALHDGCDAIDAAIATAFALAVTHPMAGNLGGRASSCSGRQSANPSLTTFAKPARQRAGGSISQIKRFVMVSPLLVVDGG